MVLLIMEWARALGFHVPAVFAYYSTRMVLAGGTTLALTIFLGPWFIRKLYEQKIGQPIRKEECPLLGKLHEKKQDTPTMGGILMLTTLTVSLLLWMDWRHAFTLILLVATLWLGAVGAWDDWLKLKRKNSRGLNPRRKLAAQGIFAGVLALYLFCPPVTQSLHGGGSWFAPPSAKEQSGELTTSQYATRYYLPFKKEVWFQLSGPMVLLAALGVAFVVIGSSNAVNLTDGLDGLASGCVLLAAGALAIVAFVSNHIELARYLHILYIEGAGEIAIFLSAMVGACLGFLWYNGHPAQVFMGDTGSLALGGLLGVSAVLLRREMLLALVGGIFVAEALSVIIQVASFRYRGKRRVFLCAPLHHHFEYKGWPETKVVTRFWIVGIMLALLGVASLKLQ